MADNNKHITIGQLKKSLLRSDERLDEALGLIVAALEEAEHICETVTLPANQWNDRVQTIQNGSLLADGKYCYFVCSDADYFTACSEAGVKADNVSVNGQITFRCEVVPDEDLVVNILRLEVAAA